jgi:hypothetical protein
MRRPAHLRLTPSQRRYLQIIGSFGPEGATHRQIDQRAERLAGRFR